MTFVCLLLIIKDADVVVCSPTGPLARTYLQDQQQGSGGLPFAIPDDLLAFDTRGSRWEALKSTHGLAYEYGCAETYADLGTLVLTWSGRSRREKDRLVLKLSTT